MDLMVLHLTCDSLFWSMSWIWQHGWKVICSCHIRCGKNINFRNLFSFTYKLLLQNTVSEKIIFLFLMLIIRGYFIFRQWCILKTKLRLRVERASGRGERRYSPRCVSGGRCVLGCGQWGLGCVIFHTCLFASPVLRSLSFSHHQFRGHCLCLKAFTVLEERGKCRKEKTR